MASLKLAMAVELLFICTAALPPLAAGLNPTAEFGTLTSLDTLAHEAASFLQTRARELPQGPSMYTAERINEAQRRQGAENVPSLQRGKENKQQKQKQTIVWLKSYARSGSSLFMALVSRMASPVFTFFEPCHWRDELEPWLEKKGCGALLEQLARCDFRGVTALFGWRRGFLNGADPMHYNPENATQACQSARMVVFKTVTWGHDLLAETIPFLNQNPQVKMIDVIRDPRSIYASMMNAHAFWGKGVVHECNSTELIDMCDHMYKGLHISHPRRFRLVYERFVAKPDEISNKIFDFLTLPQSAAPEVKNFLTNYLNNEDCPGTESHYTFCRKNSTEPAERYKMLPPDLSASFSAAESCRKVSRFYDYPVYTSGLRKDLMNNGTVPWRDLVGAT